MLLFLLRHGIAEDHAAGGGGDAARELTAKGREEVRAVVEQVLDSVDMIVSSPYRRARQTAEIAGAVLSVGRIVETDLLVPEADPELFSDWALKNFRGVKSALVVSHEPFLGALAGKLLTGSDHSLFAFSRSGIACIEWDPPGGGAVLHWFLRPDQVLEG